MKPYFYYFLEPISRELAKLLEELERAIYQSPRFMITHSRTLIEAILEKVMIHEKMENAPYLTIIERIQFLQDEALLETEVLDALHEIRKLGNIAAQDIREFRFSESLITWERIYIVVKWFVEVYGSHKIDVPPYEDPRMKNDTYDLDELHVRMERFEELLKKSIEREVPKNEEELKEEEGEEAKETTEIKAFESLDYEPGLTPVRTITYKADSIDVPHFLRDSFLLPQRFPNSVRYLVRLNGEQEARIMSELPAKLDHLHEKVTYYKEEHTATFFEELQLYIEEEIRRKKLHESRPGELFLFYKGEEIVVTEDFGKVDITVERFPGSPSMVRQLHEDGITKVKHLPKEFVIIQKYQGVGEGRVQNFFEQLKQVQKDRIAGQVSQ